MSARQIPELQFAEKPTAPPILPLSTAAPSYSSEQAPSKSGQEVPKPSPAAPKPKTSHAAESASEGGVDFGQAMVEIPKIALTHWLVLLSNFFVLFGVCWIPWVNLGAWIGTFGLCAKLGQPDVSPTEILNGRYRTLFGDLVALISLTWSNFVLCLFAAILPWGLLLICFPLYWFGGKSDSTLLSGVAVLFIGLAAVGSIASFGLTFLSIASGWALAPLLICDRGMDPSEAISKSGQLMDGNRLIFVLILFFINLAFCAAGLVIWLVLGKALFLFFIAFMALCFASSALYYAVFAYFYHHLAVDTK